jgi:hypothetical protein
MNINLLPEIEFEGKTVTAKSGKYRCPFNCHSHAHPAPTWRTENGFRAHMERCTRSPSAQLRRDQEAAMRADAAEQHCQAAVAKLGLNVGDEVFFTGYQVTGPTHEMRRGRRVRVRYEELRSYFGASARIESFSWLGSLVLNGCIPVSNLCGSLNEAKAKAAAAQKDYQSRLDFSAAVR